MLATKWVRGCDAVKLCGRVEVEESVCEGVKVGNHKGCTLQN